MPTLKNPFNARRVYRTRHPLRTVLICILAGIAAAVILALSVFFGFRKYIVYTDDGLYLDVPWLAADILPTSADASDTAYSEENRPL